MRNIELKARLRDGVAAREIARDLATDYAGVQEQTDTYFHSAHGRLKLREIAGAAAQLIWYDRPDETQPKPSRYYLAPVDRPEDVKQLFAAVCGIRVVVKKRREIFLIRNVRVHLDEVEGLGRFLEFESVLAPNEKETSGSETLAHLRRQFGISDNDLLSGSYGEMLESNEVSSSGRRNRRLVVRHS